MKKILNKPMIYRIYERVKLCKKLDEVIVAIPSSKSDDKLEVFLKKNKIKTFRGSENNLLTDILKPHYHIILII